MKKLTIYTCLLSMAGLTASAQRQRPLNKQPIRTEWESTPAVHPVPPEFANEHAYFLTDEEDIDYRHEGKTTNVYYTWHWIVKLMDARGIENFKTTGISINYDTRVPLIKARSILPNGKVHDIAKDMIKVTKDEHGRNRIVFALEGLEKGAEIEVLVKEIRPFAAFGGVSFQYAMPVLSSRFELSYPKWFIFQEKGYNGYPDAKDTLVNNRRHISIEQADIPALQPEPNSFYDLHRMRGEYRITNYLDVNENDKKQLNTWDDLGRIIYDNHCVLTKKDRAAANRYLTELGVPGHGDELENIKKIENGIKNNIVLYSYLENDSEEVLDTIIAHKAATHNGYLKLFVACFTQANVHFELGLANNRYEHSFDTKFENWGNLDNYVFYFPKQKKFLSPEEPYLRYPMVPDELINSRGIFSLIPQNGALITGGLAEIRTITPLAANESMEKINAGITFNAQMEPVVDINYSFTGYTSTALREELATTTPDKKKDLLRKLIPLAEQPEDILSYTTANEGFENYYTNKPLEITATLNAPWLTEQAGKDYVVKLGEIIGDQHELYSEKDRKMPVDLDYPHTFNRTITISIPKGYKIMNPESIRLNADYVDDNMKPVISFKSDYKLITDKKNGDKLVVNISEFYTQLHFSVNNFERYRKVINTAADFNKVALVIGKKKGA